jgi:ATP-dependent helicase/nuclease subunit B
LLELSKEITEHLARGGTLVVPTTQRAAALRLAHSAAQLAAGRRVWGSADVLPWSGWLARGLDEARERGVPVPRRLSRAEEWWLWRESVRAACADLSVLWPDALIDSVRRAVLLIEDYGLALPDAANASSAETAVLVRSRAHFNRRCRELQALWSASWSACAAYLKPWAAARLVGFAELGAARRAWLERIGVEIALNAGTETLPTGAALEVLGFDDPEQEAVAAAQWCAAQLERDPDARLLLVVQRSGEQRHRWLRALSQRLDYHSVLDPTVSDRSAVAIEGGQPLEDYPLCALALQLLRLAAGEADFADLSAVLRSPFLQPGGRETRLRLDVWLREHNVEDPHPRRLRMLLPLLEKALGPESAEELRTLIEALDPLSEKAPPTEWAQRFALMLERAGWPGQRLSSDEQQVRVRFEELLGELAAMSLEPCALEASQAWQLLHQIAARTAFEPATDDVPVTITASFDDPIVHYDGIWVAGLSAEAFPEPLHADPLIPWAAQAAAGMPGASPAAALRLAEETLQRWRGAGGRLALSFARSEADEPRDPSPLLREAAAGITLAEAGAPAPFQLETWLAAHAPQLEAWSDARGPAWPGGQAVRGGARVLELQALCPFRGFVQLRLDAQPLPEPEPGIDPRVRGQILHRALDLFWQRMPDLQTLRARTAHETLALARTCIEQAAAEVQQRAAGGLDPTLLRHETERDVRVFEQLVQWELAREPFAIEALEWSQSYRIAGATLQLRLDRVDRLADGRLVVIDYKTGADKGFDAMVERPTAPQLPAYALAAGERVAAVAALYLAREGVKLRGIADGPARLIGLNVLPDGAAGWPALLQRWRAQLSGLAQEFLSGHAAVAPQPKACEFCHLQAFCRIDLAQVPRS